jgi:GAF domain-containing protein
MSESSATDLLVEAAHALARGADRGATLDALLAGLAAATGSGSGAMFVPDGGTGELTIVASCDLGPEAAAGLTAAVRNPAHAVARTYASAETGYDVLPAAPGGPALRTHLPLIVERGDGARVVGVLALAHDKPLDPELRPVLLAVADLAAVAVERGQMG